MWESPSRCGETPFKTFITIISLYFSMAADMLVTITYFAILLGFGVLITSFTKRIRISPILFLLLVGIIFGPMGLGFVDISLMGDIPDFLRVWALIIIAFAGSFHLKMTTFKKVSFTALKLAFIGFFFSTLFLGLVAHSIFGLSWFTSFLLGAIIGGTSSAVVLSFKDTLGKSEVFDILLVESIFTDPLTVLLPVLLLDIYIVGGVASSTVFLSRFWDMLAAGVGTGVIMGFAAGKLFTKMQKEMTAILGFSIAMLTYAFASNIGGSGILGVAICGLILGNMDIPFKKAVSEFEDSLSIVLMISVFTLLGAQIALSITASLFWKEMIFLAILIFLSRPIAVFITMFNEKRSFGELMLIAFTGPRGVAAAAIAALPLTYGLAHGSEFLLAEAPIVLLTTFFAILMTVISGTIAAAIYTHKFKLIKDKDEETKTVGILSRDDLENL